MSRLVILSGPSCMGKGPLCTALRKWHPQLARSLHKVVLYNSRAPRPGEADGVDYHFRTRHEIEALHARDGFAVIQARADLQALDLNALEEALDSGDAFFEGNPYVARALQTCPLPDAAERLSIFLSPLSRDEIHQLQDPQLHLSLPDLVTDLMRRKLLRRTQKQKTTLSLNDLENIERRAACAYPELKLAHHFDHVVPNHDGEDSENWDAFRRPIGDARRTLLAFVDLLSGRVPPCAETWDETLIP